MKKFILTSAFIASASLAFIGCSSENEAEKCPFEQVEEYYFKQVPITEVGKGNYIYEVYNDDYETSYLFDPLSMSGDFNGASQKHGVCAGIRNGNLFGRNLDWMCGESPEFIVHTPAKNGRHATLGICTTPLLDNLPEPKPKSLSQWLVNTLTQTCYDGVNDAGVCMVLLVVHYKDGGVEPTATNPMAQKTVHGINLLRYVIDNANSAAHGIELMKNINTYGTLQDYTFHWLLCDEKENYFVEIMGNELKVTKVEENPIEKFRKPIITNFYLQKDTTQQVIPGGTERYDILSKEYDKANSVSGMFNALKNIRYSRRYEGKNPAEQKEKGLPDNNWYSEYYCNVTQPKTDESLYFDKNSSRQEMWDKMLKDDVEVNDIAKFQNPRKHPTTQWTCHTSVYNIKERTMQVVTGEHYNNILPSSTTSFKIGK